MSLSSANLYFVIFLQEIEEDKKKAEQEGIAVKTHPPRKGRPHDGPPEGDRWRTENENFTVTVDLFKPAGVRSGGGLCLSAYFSTRLYQTKLTNDQISHVH